MPAEPTTSTATLILENQHERRIKISIRGLTGAMAVGDTYSSEGISSEL